MDIIPATSHNHSALRRRNDGIANTNPWLHSEGEATTDASPRRASPSRPRTRSAAHHVDRPELPHTVPNCNLPAWATRAVLVRNNDSDALHAGSIWLGLQGRGLHCSPALGPGREPRGVAVGRCRLVHLRAAIFHPWLCGWQCAGLEPQAPASLAPVPERRAPAPAVMCDCVGRTETSTSRFPFRDSIPSATTGKGLFGEPATAKRERSHGLGKPLTQRGSDVRPLYCLPRRLYWRLRDLPGHDAWSRTPLSTELR